MKTQTAREIVDESFKGLKEFIDDPDILEWYKGLIVTCMKGYAQQFKPDWDELRKEFYDEIKCTYNDDYGQWEYSHSRTEIFNWFKNKIERS